MSEARRREKIHPAANLFPMMTDEELQELAADIATNGLIHPIIIDDQQQIVDGRNRLAACRIAEVEPRFESLNGNDPLAFIVSTNIARRHLSKGQQAMLTAMIYPEGTKGKRSPETGQFSKQRLSDARSVLRYSRELAERVIRGAVSLDEALKDAEKAKQQALSIDAKLARLREHAPDLATRVAEENLSLDEAMAIFYERDKREVETRESGRMAAAGILHFCGQVSSIRAAIELGEDIRIEPETLKMIGDAYQTLKKEMERKKRKKTHQRRGFNYGRCGGAGN